MQRMLHRTQLCWWRACTEAETPHTRRLLLRVVRSRVETWAGNWTPRRSRVTLQFKQTPGCHFEMTLLQWQTFYFCYPHRSRLPVLVVAAGPVDIQKLDAGSQKGPFHGRNPSGQPDVCRDLRWPTSIDNFDGHFKNWQHDAADYVACAFCFNVSISTCATA